MAIHSLARKIKLTLLVALAAPAAHAMPFKVGVIAPQTGTSSYLGQPFLDGAEVGAYIFGPASKIELELSTCNDLGEPVEARKCADRMIAEGVHVILGAANSACTIEVRKACENVIPLVSPISTATQIINSSTAWTFRVNFSDRTMMNRLLTVLEQRNLRRLADIYVGDLYGSALHDDMQQLVGERPSAPFEIVSSSKFDAKKLDLKPIIARLTQVQPDAIGLFGLTPSSVEIAKQVRAAGILAPFFVTTANSSDQFRHDAGAAANGTLTVTTYDPQNSTAANADFRSEYKNRKGRDPDNFAAQGYDASGLIVEALSALVADPRFSAHEPLSDTRRRLRDALAKASHKGVTGTVEYDPGGHGERKGAEDVAVMVACNGRLQSLGTSCAVVVPDSPLVAFVKANWSSILWVLLVAGLLHPRTLRRLLAIDAAPIQTVANALYTSPLGRSLLVRPHFRLLLRSAEHERVQKTYLKLPMRPIEGNVLPALGTEVQRRAAVTVLGASGAGKSTLVHRCMVELAQSKDTARMPFVLDGRSYTGKLYEDICRTVTGIQLKPAYLKTLAQSGSLSILLDGASEVEPELRMALVSELRALRDEPDNRILITSRELFDELRLLDTQILELGPIPSELVEEYVGLYISSPEAKRELVDAIHASELLRELPKTAQMLKMFATVYTRLGRIPIGTMLYEEYIAELVTRTALEKTGVRFLLRSLAEQFFWQTSTRKGFTEADVVQYLGGLAPALKNWGIECSAITIVSELRRAGILVIARGMLSFAHDSLEDFCCAKALYEEMKSGRIDLKHPLDTELFKETFQFVYLMLMEDRIESLAEVRRTFGERFGGALRSAAIEANLEGTSVSSAEMTAVWRSCSASISQDALSGSLASNDGRNLAAVFRDDIYPLIERHIGVRARFFLENGVELLRPARFDSCVSLGSGLSLLTKMVHGRLAASNGARRPHLRVAGGRAAKLRRSEQALLDVISERTDWSFAQRGELGDEPTRLRCGCLRATAFGARPGVSVSFANHDSFRALHRTRRQAALRGSRTSIQ